MHHDLLHGTSLGELLLVEQDEAMVRDDVDVAVAPPMELPHKAHDALNLEADMPKSKRLACPSPKLSTSSWP